MHQHRVALFFSGLFLGALLTALFGFLGWEIFSRLEGMKDMLLSPLFLGGIGVALGFFLLWSMLKSKAFGVGILLGCLGTSLAAIAYWSPQLLPAPLF